MWTFSNCLFNSSITGWLRRYSLCLTLPDSGSLTVIASFGSVWNAALSLFMNSDSWVRRTSASRYMVCVRTIYKSFLSATRNAWSWRLFTWSFVSNVGRFWGIIILTPVLTDLLFFICLLFAWFTALFLSASHLLCVRSLWFDILLAMLGGSFHDVIIGFLLILAHLILLDASLHHLTVHEFIHFSSELPKIFERSRRDASIAVIRHSLSESQRDR